ncbi:MAG: cytochrome C [Deltaproteobacteria bacterium]|nr:MAG: cytochrome C [Deltaproteobacteria bacterium]
MAETTLTGVPLDPEEVKASAAKRRAAASALPDKVHTWPYLVRAEFISGIILMAFLMLWSIIVDAPLEEPANPALTPNPSKAPWYFLGLQELLVYFDPWIAGVVLPSLIITGLMVIPYVDINPKGNGYYTFKERPFAISIFLFGFIGLWIIPIVLGVFFRGPGWNIYMPWEYWDPHRVVEMTNVNLPYLLGVRSYEGSLIVGGITVLGYLGAATLGPWLLFKNKPFFKELGFIRWLVVSAHLAIMFGVVIKMVLRLTLSVKYIWVTPFFNI